MLDLQPTDSIPAELAIQNETDLKSAILGCYDAMQSDSYYGRGLLIINEIGTDNAYNGGSIIEFGQINNYNVLADNLYLDGLWTAPYIAINRCNTVIYYLDKLNLSNDKKNTYLAEILFIRALNYYNLTRLFKDVPLKLNPTFSESDLNIPVSAQSDIYTQILTDLNFANGKIANTSSYVATDLAVKTLLAKIHLELGNYNNAITYADTVIASNKKLVDNYSTLFTTEGNTESIFELSYTDIISDKNRLAEYCFPPNLKGRYEIAPETNLLNSFETNDIRKSLFLGPIPYCNKYENITGGSDNVYIFRLAELFLLRAEARARQNGNIALIRNDINTIRNRAGLDSIFNNSYSELLIIIEQERRHEFAFEGHRWFDLVRTGRADEILGIPENKYYFPIPLSEVNTNDEIN
ncbi:MAG: RagB/SusD family nutrient uptake outer membrane protein [Desulfobacterales bacterium]|nr:RagB/SusD family nutrient uptake outer membrane protein [Desulfobacterales bacterium]